MPKPSEVTAVIHTRGDNDLSEVLASLIGYSDVLIWTPAREDRGVYGRYELVAEAWNEIVYVQDDDCVVPPMTQWALLDAYEPGVLVANYGHGENPDGYDDMALVHGGAIFDRLLPPLAFQAYLKQYPYDDDFEREADMIFGTLTPHRHIHMPYTILPLASDPSRMCNQPWQREKKLRVTERARALRQERSAA